MWQHIKLSWSIPEIHFVVGMSNIQPKNVSGRGHAFTHDDGGQFVSLFWTKLFGLYASMMIGWKPIGGDDGTSIFTVVTESVTE